MEIGRLQRKEVRRCEIKDRPINKYAYLPVGTSNHRLQESNASEAFTWFGQMAATMLHELDIVSPILVPFPSSDCTIRVPATRTRRLADGVVLAYDATVCDVLRFDRPMPSANKGGGTRRPELIYPRLRIVGPLPGERKVVLVDDVVTSGGHLRAAAAFLATQGHVVAAAVCGVSAGQEPVARPFDKVRRVLDDYVPA